MSKKIYFDTEMGAAGDMLAGALADLLDNPEEALEELNEAIQGSGLEDVVAELAEHFSNGIKGEEFNVNVDEESEDYKPFDLDDEEYYDHHHHYNEFKPQDDDYPDHFDDRPRYRSDENHHHEHFDSHPHHEHFDTHPHYEHFDDHPGYERIIVHSNRDDHSHPHFHEDWHSHGRRPRHGRYEHKPCGEFRRPPRKKCNIIGHRPEMDRFEGCPIELHFHLHLGETVIKGKKPHRHHKHHHHGHHKHHRCGSRDHAKMDVKAGKKQNKKVQKPTNKKTISMNHHNDHLNV